MVLTPHKTAHLMFVAALLCAVQTAWSAPLPHAATPTGQFLRAPDKPMRVDGLVQAVAGWTHQESGGIDDRPLFSTHRARLWLRGRAHQRVRYVFQLAADRVAADELALLQGKPLDNRLPVVLDANLQWDVLGDGRLKVTAGYFRPQVGRESNTVVPALPSHEMGLTGALARRGSVQVGHGRSGGVNVGGATALGPLTLAYNLGAFTPQRSGKTDGGQAYTQSLGGRVSPLLAGNLIFAFGETKQFRAGGLLWLGNPWRRATGGSVGVTFSRQGQTDHFGQSLVLTGFATFSVAGLFGDAEWVQASRETPAGTSYANTAWHARIGYNIRVESGLVSPFAMINQLSGDDVTQTAWEGGLSALGLFAGTGRVVDVGVNWHLRAHLLRLGLHGIYTTRDGPGPVSQPMRPGWSGILTLQLGS